MFAAIYRWEVDPDREREFKEGWYRTSMTVRRRYGSLGSRLHRTDSGLFVSYGRWHTYKDREAYRANLAVDPEGFRLMQTSIMSELPTIDMTIIGNLLDEHVPQGLYKDQGLSSDGQAE